MSKIAVIIGAGPAGLTAAFELLQRSDVKPIVLEADSQVGGISKTINYRGNRMDLGGHRFFSKSDWVMNWWQSILPVMADPASEERTLNLTYQGQHRSFSPNIQNEAKSEKALIVRSRLSRIFYRRRFFDYPLKINWNTLKNLGVSYTASVGASYIAAQLAPRKPETTLEDFLVNRFGDKLYRTFFKDYTEKVWGVACSEISAEWGAQRIKGLSIIKAITHALSKPLRAATDTSQKTTETSLIERFLYPVLGPGQIWEEVASRVVAAGGEIHLTHKVVGIQRRGKHIAAVDVYDSKTCSTERIACDFLISTMPVKELTQLLQPENPSISKIAAALPYRDFMTAGLLVKRMQTHSSNQAADNNGMPPDNWIYVQEPDVKLGRLQIFNNWSPALVADPRSIWLGLEYFCNEDDDIWNMRAPAFLDFASRELAKIGLIALNDVIDGTVVRVPKAYPAYFGEYRNMNYVRAFLDEFPNLFPVGRNGMHRYNNQDHSMLAAKAAVDCIAQNKACKTEIWSINVDGDYHEEISRDAVSANTSAAA